MKTTTGHTVIIFLYLLQIPEELSEAQGHRTVKWGLFSNCKDIVLFSLQNGIRKSNLACAGSDTIGNKTFTVLILVV